MFVILSEYSLYGLLFFLPISISFVEGFSSLVLFSFAVRKIIKPDFAFIKSGPNRYLFIFLIFSAFSLLNCGNYLLIGLKTLFMKWLRYAGICIVLQDYVYDRKIIKRGIYIFIFSGILVVLSGISQFFLYHEFLLNNKLVIMDNQILAMTSSFNHYNDFGAYLVVVMSLASALLIRDKRFDIRASALLIFCMVSAVAVMFTFSRGSWVSMAFSFVFLSILSRRNLVRLIPIFLVFVGMLRLPVFWERLLFMFRLGGDADRFRYWAAAWEMIKDHPLLGVGLGTFMANFSKYLPSVNISYAHNCYLQIWAESGIFTLISFMAFIALLIRGGIKEFLRSKDFILLGLLTGAAGFLIHSFFDTNMYSFKLAFLFWVWTGIILNLSSSGGSLSRRLHSSDAEKARHLINPKKYQFTKFTIAVAVFMVISASFARQLMDFVVAFAGEGGFKVIANSVLAGSAAIFFVLEARRIADPLRIVSFFALQVFISLYLLKIDLPEIRINMLMYIILGWLATRDMMRFGRGWKSVIFAAVFAGSIGVFGELFQKLLPYRMFEIKDMTANFFGVILGMILYSMRSVNKK